MPGAQSRWNAGKDLTWEPLRIELVAEVAYEHLQGDRFRHTARFQRWRPDREPVVVHLRATRVAGAHGALRRDLRCLTVPGASGGVPAGHDEHRGTQAGQLGRCRPGLAALPGPARPVRPGLPAGHRRLHPRRGGTARSGAATTRCEADSRPMTEPTEEGPVGLPARRAARVPVRGAPGAAHRAGGASWWPASTRRTAGPGRSPATRTAATPRCTSTWRSSTTDRRGRRRARPPAGAGAALRRRLTSGSRSSLPGNRGGDQVYLLGSVGSQTHRSPSVQRRRGRKPTFFLAMRTPRFLKGGCIR